MYSITLSIKDKKIFDTMITDLKRELNNKEEGNPFHKIENIQITETSMSGELNATIEELED